MKRVENYKFIECPKCNSQAVVKKRGLVVKILVAAILIFAILSRTMLLINIIGIRYALLPIVKYVLLIYLPFYFIFDYLIGLRIECPQCRSQYNMSTKEFNDRKRNGGEYPLQ